MKVTKKHSCDLMATSHWDINATLCESRQGTQMRPHCGIASGHLMRFHMKVAVGQSCDVALGHECNINATLYMKVVREHVCDPIATSHWTGHNDSNQQNGFQKEIIKVLTMLVHQSMLRW